MAKKSVEPEQETAAKKKGGRLTGTIRTVILASVGAVGVTQDQLTALIDRLVERGEMTEKDARKLVGDVRKQVNKRRKGGAQKAEKEMETALDKMSIPSKADIEDLSKQVALLSKRIEELKQDLQKA